MCLIGLFLNPMCAFYFWPMMLGIQVLGLFVSLLFRAVIQVFLLLAIFVVGGLFWMVNIPADALGAVFFIFILGAGSLLSAGILVVAVQLPRILAAVNISPGEERSGAMIPEKWLSAAPVAGVFILIGFSFFVNHPHFPHMGMATLACFLILAVFFARRVQFQPVAIIALVGAAAGQAMWVLNTSHPETVILAGHAFTLLFAYTLNQEIVSILGFAGFGLGLLWWKKDLASPFRMAGLVLIMVALVRSLGVPFRFGRQFTAMVPLVNFPTFMYAILLALIIFLLYKNPKQRWPVRQVPVRQFMGVALTATAFAVMNIEIAACLGRPGEPFSLLAPENYMKLLAYSIGWMVFAIGMLMAGIRFSLPLCRWVATGLICITVVKVFFADTAKLAMGYKIASFSILSLGLFFVAYLYQKFISDEPPNTKADSNQ